MHDVSEVGRARRRSTIPTSIRATTCFVLFPTSPSSTSLFAKAIMTQLTTLLITTLAATASLREERGDPCAVDEVDGSDKAAQKDEVEEDAMRMMVSYNPAVN